MATLTAHAFVGSLHPNQGGIVPTHQLSLWENDRPRYYLGSVPLKSVKDQICWIPTNEWRLEDGLLLIAMHLVCPEAFGKAVEQSKGRPKNPFVIYDHWDEAEHQRLLAICRELPEFPKVTWTMMEGCYLFSAIDQVKHYGMDMEICAPIFSRFRSPWTGGTHITNLVQHFRSVLRLATVQSETKLIPKEETWARILEENPEMREEYAFSLDEIRRLFEVVWNHAYAAGRDGKEL